MATNRSYHGLVGSIERDDETMHGDVRARLRSADQIYTSGRRRLVEALAEVSRPITVPELIATRPDIAVSSAYRNMAVLEESGVVARIVGGGEHARFELTEALVGHHHHHLICQSCGRVDDFTVPDSVEEAVERALAEVAVDRSFDATSHRLDLVGTCSDCRR